MDKDKATTEATRRLGQRALRLSYVTVGYNLLEAAASLLAGVWAGSIALVGFGLDSVVESLSGGIMIWRFRGHGRLSAAEEERRERRAVRLVGYTFYVLAAYVFYEAAEKLYYREPPEPTLIGIVIAGISVIAMPALFFWKRSTARALGSGSLMADAKQTLACFLLSVALLIGLGLNYGWGFWEADPLVGLGVALVLVREGREALREGRLCSCSGCPGCG